VITNGAKELKSWIEAESLPLELVFIVEREWAELYWTNVTIVTTGISKKLKYMSE